MIRRFAGLAVLACAFAICGSASTVVSALPNPATVAVGDFLTLDFHVETDANIFGFSLDVTYDPSFLLLDSVTEQGDAALYSVIFDPGDSSTPGLISTIFDGFTNAVTGSNTILAVRFLATSTGSGTVSFTNIQFSDDTATDVPVDSGSSTPDTLVTAAVPEPSLAAPLFLAAAGMAWLRRRRRG